MNDTKTTIKDVKALINHFVEERDWRQFHGAKNLSMDIAVEAAELMEFFRYIERSEIPQTFDLKRESIEHEIADIFFALLKFCNEYSIDLSSALEKKIALTAKKYPVEKSRGCNKKYTELDQ